MDSLENEWSNEEKELAQLAILHETYCDKVDEVKALQTQLSAGISKHNKELKKISENVTQTHLNEADENAADTLDKLNLKIDIAKNTLRNFEDVLPRENGLYLKIILGSVNVSLLSKKDKFKYKDNYENFKVTVTLIIMALTFFLVMCPSYRAFDAIQQFLLVWYYCTLSIREHILKMNGSRIKGWWILHHFISSAAAGVMLLWPDGYTYQQVRLTYHIFIMYIALTQLIQGYYQKGCLYRLRALGDRHVMDITVEGFQSWMWKGLTFVLPFLIFGYFFQFYVFYVLWTLSGHEKCIEWQVYTDSILIFIIFLGNVSTTTAVLRNKLKELGWKEKVSASRSYLDHMIRNKYNFNIHEQFIHMRETVNKKYHLLENRFKGEATNNTINECDKPSSSDKKDS